MKSETWGLLLAGGDGSRVSALSVDDAGRYLPKQFCSFGTGSTLLHRTVERACSIAPRSRLVVSLTEPQRAWWERELCELPSENLVVQPRNRGTAPAMLLALLTLSRRSPEAKVVVLPSDHFVEREEILGHSIRWALEHARDRVVLLGVPSERADTEVGWIRPLTAADSSLHRVDSFVEKPDAREASDLLRTRALVNTLILVSPVSALLELYRQALPSLSEALERTQAASGELRAKALRAVYDEMPYLDFSRRVLEPAAPSGQLWVLEVPPCGWWDLGTAERLRALRQRMASPDWKPSLERAPDRFGSDYWLG